MTPPPPRPSPHGRAAGRTPPQAPRARAQAARRAARSARGARRPAGGRARRRHGRRDRRSSARAAISTRCARSPSARTRSSTRRTASELGVIPAEREPHAGRAQAQISPWLPKATVAIEDRRFYQHGGVDPVGIARAVVADVERRQVRRRAARRSRRSSSATSTSRASGRCKRKLIEACLAIKLARQWSKDRILTAYMNQVFYGNHAYGIEAAAETYFSRTGEGADARAGGAARRAAAGAVELRPVPQPGGRARASQRGAAARCS